MGEGVTPKSLDGMHVLLGEIAAREDIDPDVSAQLLQLSGLAKSAADFARFIWDEVSNLQLVATNAETSRDTAHRTLSLIAQLATEAQQFHPMHPDTFPDLLGRLDRLRAAEAEETAS